MKTKILNLIQMVVVLLIFIFPVISFGITCYYPNTTSEVVTNSPKCCLVGYSDGQNQPVSECDRSDTVVTLVKSDDPCDSVNAPAYCSQQAPNVKVSSTCYDENGNRVEVTGNSCWESNYFNINTNPEEIQLPCYGPTGQVVGYHGPKGGCKSGNEQNPCALNPVEGCSTYNDPNTLKGSSSSDSTTQTQNPKVDTQKHGWIPSDTDIAENGFKAFSTMINDIINWFITISVSIAAITFAIAGGRMLMNPENSGEREKAKEMFKKTVIGMLIVLGAWLIVHTIVTTLVATNDPTNALRFLK